MKKILLLLLFVLFSNAFSQDNFCATIANTSSTNYSSLSKLQKSLNFTNEQNICLNVFFHIVKNNDGTGGISDYEWQGIISDLNTDYAPYKISFNLLGYDYINNTFLNDIQSPSLIGNLVAINNKPNAINIYIVDDAFFNGYGDINGRNVVIKKDYATTHVMSHEVGHNLNLYHTHETQFGVENPNNCGATGDLICDTPRDSNIRACNIIINQVLTLVPCLDSNCNYTKGDGLSPDTHNYMSYTSPTCMNRFSVQQAVRMRDSILNSPILQQIINCSCSNNTLLGKSTLCSGENNTYFLPCGSANFSYSQNLSMVSVSSNSITVSAINSTINESAYIDYTINGVTKRKEIWVGKPKGDVVFSPTANYVDLELVGVNSDIHKQEITDIKWEVLSVTGNGVMGSAYNSFYNLTHGNSTNWSINAVIKVTNACGTTNIYKTITPQQVSCRTSKLVKTGNKKYQWYKIIDPCVKTSKTRILNDNEIIRTDVLDSNGKVIQSFSKMSSFNFEDVPSNILYVRSVFEDGTINSETIINQ